MKPYQNKIAEKIKSLNGNFNCINYHRIAVRTNDLNDQFKNEMKEIADSLNLDVRYKFEKEYRYAQVDFIKI